MSRRRSLTLEDNASAIGVLLEAGTEPIGTRVAPACAGAVPTVDAPLTGWCDDHAPVAGHVTDRGYVGLLRPPAA
jgi:hypothetical protein